MITGDTASDSDLLELADIGVSVAKNVSGAAFEECDVVVGNDSFETVTDILTLARQVHLNVKRCISAALTSLIVLIAFAAFNLFIGTDPSSFVVDPVLGSLISVLIVPAAAYMFCDNTADLRNLTVPSVYIGRGKLRPVFFVRPLIQAFGIALSEIIYYLISSGPDKENVARMVGLSRSGFLLIFVFGLMIACISNLSDRSLMDSLRSGQILPWTIAGITVAVSLALMFIPVINTFFGLEAPEILSVFIALALTVLLQIPAELLRMTMRKVRE
jgi:Ca2+-transporting ATPase